MVVYAFLLFAFRVAGKRQLGQLSPFDLIVLLLISNAVQNALIGDDVSLGGGLIGATVLLSSTAWWPRYRRDTVASSVSWRARPPC